MVTIYAPQQSNRLIYIASHLFQNILGADCVFTDEKETFLNSNGCCINYSAEDLNKGIRIHPHTLLYETEVVAQTIRTGEWKELPCFFLQTEGDIPFDLFAASFYLLTRYEEYTGDTKDFHGRFLAEASLACREGFLEIPLVDRWAHLLKERLADQGDTLECIPRSFRLVSTFDIDHPYLYLNKGLLKNLVGSTRDILRKDWQSWITRTKALLHLTPDPYLAAIRNIINLYRKLGRDFFAFIHVGKYGKFDRRTLYPHRRFYALIRSLYDVRFGLHPSYKASFDTEMIRKEKKKLENILGHQVRRNRQHFLRMRLPDTYRTLNSLLFEEDFTMAYAALPGFRASTAIPFHFFDIETNETTPLLIRPTIVMDTTFTDYLKASPEKTRDKIKQLLFECYQSGGDFTMLWHNSSLTNPDENEWFRVFSDSLSLGIKLEEQQGEERKKTN